MIDTPIGGDQPPSGSTALGDSQSPRLLSLVVGSADRPVCTIYPPDVATPYRSTRWLRARGNGFVDRKEWR